MCIASLLLTIIFAFNASFKNKPPSKYPALVRQRERAWPWILLISREGLKTRNFLTTEVRSHHAEEFKNGDFTLKTHQMFFIHIASEEFENATTTGHFRFDENSVRKIRWLSWRQRFRKTLLSKSFSSTWKRKAGVFKFLWFEECFRNLLRFRDGLVWRIVLTRRRN